MQYKWMGATAAMCVMATPQTAIGQTKNARAYNIPEQDLSAALKAFAATSGREIVAASDDVANKRSAAVVGTFTPQQAVAKLLIGTGMSFRIVDGAFVIRPAATSNAGDEDADAADIVVTGSRIRGAPIPSPVITIDQAQIRNAGQATLGDVVRNIPQSFGGGQNPGIGFNVPAINGVDVGGGSSINLRGLGSDATLTLLNGHRISYSGSRQSVDVSTIPVGAVERIEIVADGASALYGSDAVGGVANIILKRDMNGLETRARLATSTQGGDFQQQYDVIGGHRWRTGGLIAAYEFNRNTAVEAWQRSYAATRSPGLTLFPSLRNHNAVVSGHQQLTSALKFSIDALFNDRRSAITYAQNPAGDLSVSGAHQVTKTRAYAIAPTLSVAVGDAWNLALSGSYAGDRTNYRIDGFSAGSSTLLGAGCYCNGAQSVELAGDGPLFNLPAGPAKVALGIGYRNVSLRNDRGAGSPLNFERSQSNRYAYGELSIPVVGPAMAIPAVYRLNLSAALRYERYQETGSVATPKFGLVYAPTSSLDLKASWGKSFRAPTLLQRYQPPALTLLNAAVFGEPNPPPGSSALYIQGGNAALSPERATSWSVTGSFHPPAIPGLTAEISYFDTRYINRIVTPIGFITQALSNPVYAAQVTRSPSQQMLDSILASGASFVNATGAPYDPANVIGFIDNSNVNAGRQWVHGVDMLASYHGKIGRDTIALNANASYLTSHRQINASQPDLPLAGILFNPPHWRGRASATWSRDDFSLTAIANYSGALRDTRYSPAAELPSQFRFDFTARYHTGDSSPYWLRGIDITLGVENAFDVDPPTIFTTTVTDTPYDSTNYSPLGRVISLAVSKSW
ncbi:TonB-dependent receptor [Stakelama marina]|uniref:TonB-dependent receptor n=1 Tax=Stakelama marina TaxID=2826939 RepID=A0A8T4IKK6_9SPHN|nr:TonB-dependent receptor [Stakelama marina]MBR0552716.1 TonB-dependent receptor [Stakelama marina]